MILFAIALAVTATPQASSDWRAAVTRPDRARLRGWRAAWTQALERARDGGHATALARDPALFDPDRALTRPIPPVGAYRCRMIKLGAKHPGAPDYAVRPSAACRVTRDADGLRFVTLGGAQRVAGRLFRHDDSRAVFVGSLMLGSEGPMPYGRDPMRDTVGQLDRIGDRRWRLALPSPAFESLIDVIELTPV